ncbi:MAG: Ni/Fe hydrogenase subunit alpha [Candidatus Woesearchaeota archaeon]
MHNVDFDLSIDHLSKIEGHGELDLKVKQGKVEHIHFKITENKRFYTTAIEGKPFLSAPSLMSRICGTCSIAHLICCIEAIENALDFKPSKQTELLRKLTMYSLMIRDHALHLYFFSLPDVLGKDSVLDFDEKNEFEHNLVHEAFELKAAGNNLSKLIAGKAVHAPYPMVTGFTKIPDKEGIKKSIEELKKVRKNVFNIMSVFENWNANLERETTFIAQINPDFSFIGGNLKTTTGKTIEQKDYANYLERTIIPYSTATGYKFEDGNYFVGSLARLNLNKDNLHPNTKRDAEKYLKLFPSKNIFHNNLAQAIEILHSIDHSIEILENNNFEQEKLTILKPKKSSGIGVIEAPRGTLYYKVDIAENGLIEHADVIVPTQQNQINIENDIKTFVENNLEMDKEKMSLEIEKIIRAYDPCMSCATHFLKINWL